MNRRLAAVSLALAALLLAGCSSPAATPAPGRSSAASDAPAAETPTPEPVPLDLSGEWKQTNSNTPDAWQAATISGETIVINWVSDNGDTRSLYWAGSYVLPTSPEDSFTWDSVNDTTQTANAMLASDAPTKTFTYANGELSYEASALGTTMVIRMARQ